MRDVSFLFCVIDTFSLPYFEFSNRFHRYSLQQLFFSLVTRKIYCIKSWHERRTVSKEEHNCRRKISNMIATQRRSKWKGKKQQPYWKRDQFNFCIEMFFLASKFKRNMAPVPWPTTTRPIRKVWQSATVKMVIQTQHNTKSYPALSFLIKQKDFLNNLLVLRPTTVMIFFLLWCYTFFSPHLFFFTPVNFQYNIKLWK